MAVPWVFLNAVPAAAQSRPEGALLLVETEAQRLREVMWLKPQLARAQSGWELGPCDWVPLLPEGCGPSSWAGGAGWARTYAAWC